MLYDFMQMPRSEIQDVFIDLHEKKVALEHRLIEATMQIERLVEFSDRLEESVKIHREEVERLEPFERMFMERQKAGQTIGDD